MYESTDWIIACASTTGNFLRDPLPSADVLMFGRVLHNWDLPTKKMHS